mgnify:CR=1 FL=1
MSTDALTTFALTLGKAQIDAMFRRQAQYATDDSEFVPMVEAVLTVFETVGVDQGAVEELWHHAYTAYDCACREADPEYSFDENKELMQGYLIGPRKLARRRKQGRH